MQGGKPDSGVFWYRNDGYRPRTSAVLGSGPSLAMWHILTLQQLETRELTARYYTWYGKGQTDVHWS